MNNSDLIMAKFIELVFQYNNYTILSIPLFLLLLLAEGKNVRMNEDKEYGDLKFFENLRGADTPSVQKNLISYLQARISWDSLSKHLSCSPDSLKALEKYGQKNRTISSYTLFV
jgi:hypothetical protein